MYLKEIDIKGFKSFANKIKLNITPGITVIVGPNGCGKSNIIDAVRWILGEQNIRSLRGNNLTDMIFAGSSQQKMRNLAEVSILFDNSDKKLSIDSEEVELKRIIYRSGDTDNYINGMPCKLKDIHEIFSGTGVGRNSYSIIAQGKVEFILNAKPSERRILFEEASNISNYKTKKDNVLKKLEKVKSNLVRIDDIISEVKESLQHYKEKTDNLNSYHYYRDNIKKLEYYLLSQQYILYYKNTKKHENNFHLLNKEIEKFSNHTKQFKDEIKLVEKEKMNIENELINCENCLENLDKEKVNINNRLILIKQKINDLDQRTDSTEKEIQNTKNQFNKFTKNISDIEADLQESEKQYQLIMENCKNDNLYLEKYKEKYKYYSNLLQSTESSYQKFSDEHVKKYREEIIKNETVLSSVESSILAIKKETKNLRDEFNRNEKIFVEKEKIITNIKINIAQLNDKKKKIEDELDKNNIAVTDNFKTIKEFDNDIILKRKEKEFLEELIKNNPNKIKKIDEELFIKNGFQNIELFKDINNIIRHVPDNLNKIIKILLKNNLQFLKINDGTRIQDLNKFIKENNLGQIRLFSNNISKNNIDKKLAKTIFLENQKNNLNIIGFANTLITYKDEYNSLFECLLGHVLIVKNTTSALDIFRKITEQWTIVDLDGVMIDLNGTITLNIFSNDDITDKNLLPEEKVIQLKKDIQEIYIKKNKNENNLSRIKNKINQLKYQEKNIEIEIKELETKMSRESDNIVEIYKKKDRIENQSGSLALKIEEEENKKLLLSNKLKIFKEKIGKIEEYLESFQFFHHCIQKLNIICNKDIEKLKKNIENNKMKINWNSERKGILEKRKIEMDNFIQTYNSEEKEKQERIRYYNNEKKILIEQESVLEKKLKEVVSQVQIMNEKKLTYREDNKKQDNILRNAREKIENNQDLIEEKKNKLHEYEMNKVQNQEKINNLLNTINKQYNSSIDEILDCKNEASSQKEAINKITDYKEKISAMGQINFDAMQEYQKHADRYNELKLKREEIIKSKGRLVDLINEIDRVAEENFYGTFLKVESSFKDIFNRLFRGGQASLKLTNESNILETGIELMVQPPGKKLQNISLLSTGEKSLTAIALLFALWKANPSPFCFFDEIDSALDESNAARLATFFKNEDFKDAQIIIITHQRGLMETADALYGITMEDSGISKLMSVKILDSEDSKN